MAFTDRTFRRNLPELRREGATYFLTWSLADRRSGLSPAEREIVFNAIRHFDGSRYALLAVVVMDDHVHVLVRPFPGELLSKILHSWKSFSAHVLVNAGRTAPVWLDEYRDSIIRDPVHLAQAARYIAKNPTQRWPEAERYPWVLVAPACGTGLWPVKRKANPDPPASGRLR
jgi:REP element-mobilizing transposase RayT